MSEAAERLKRMRARADILRFKVHQIQALYGDPRRKDGSLKHAPTYEAKAAEYAEEADDIEWLLAQVRR